VRGWQTASVSHASAGAPGPDDRRPHDPPGASAAGDGAAGGAGDSPFRHENTSRDAAPQFVLPLVARIERSGPPSRTDALETAARSVLAVLFDERSSGEGEWAGAIRDWQDARIRKVVRRARGAEWRRASALPGITVTGETAEVRVFPPVPLDGWPKDLARLQVSGTDLGDPEPPAPPAPGLPVLWLSPLLEMSAGKAMAQAGHGAQLAWWELGAAERAAWAESGFALAVRVSPSAEHWESLLAAGLPVVRDAGFTEIAAGSSTVVADHPALRGR
jgi:peptidyl-tRNA hydrolase